MKLSERASNGAGHVLLTALLCAVRFLQLNLRDYLKFRHRGLGISREYQRDRQNNANRSCNAVELLGQRRKSI